MNQKQEIKTKNKKSVINAIAMVTTRRGRNVWVASDNLLDLSGINKCIFIPRFKVSKFEDVFRINIQFLFHLNFNELFIFLLKVFQKLPWNFHQFQYHS